MSLATQNPKKRIAVEVVCLFTGFHLFAIIGPFVMSFEPLLRAASLSTANLAYFIAAAFSSIPLILFVMKSSGAEWSEFGFRKWRWSIDPAYLFIALGTFFFVHFAAYWISYRDLHFAAQNPLMSDATWVTKTLMTIRYLVAGFSEELFYRSYLNKRLDDLFGKPVWSVLISAVAFGSVHMYQGWHGVLVIGIDGLLLALLYRLTKNVLPLALAHATFNCILSRIWL